MAHSSSHEHYPVSIEERQELYEDLRDFAGLSHAQAVETVGFEVARQVSGCPDTGPLAAFLIVSCDTSPFKSKASTAAYHRGSEIGAEAARELSHV